MGRSNRYNGNSRGGHRRHNSDNTGVDRLPQLLRSLPQQKQLQQSRQQQQLLLDDDEEQQPSSSRQHQLQNGRGLQHYHRQNHQRSGQNGDGGTRPQRWLDFSQPPPPIALPIRAESDIPGYSYDPTTGKYYAILDNAPGQPSGSTQSDLNRLRKDYDRNMMLLKLEEKRYDIVCQHAPSLPHLFAGLALGGGQLRQAVERQVDEFRLRRVYQRSNYTINASAEESLLGCQYLDVRQDGRTLIGCWGVDTEGHSQSRLLSYRVDVDSRAAQDVLQKRDIARRRVESRAEENSANPTAASSTELPAGNSYGLRFEPAAGSIYINATLVDMAVAPADTDVTCILYATARSYIRQGAARTCFGVHMRAIDALSAEEVRQTASAPIYNVNLPIKEPVWSCAFDANNMRIGVGMDKCATIYNYLTNNIYFRVSSGGKNVIAQQFSKCGNNLFLGRLSAPMVALDLRAGHNHTVGQFAQSWSTCFVHQMRHRPHHILTDNFEGKMRIFDTRSRTCLLEFNDHRNSSHKLPCFVDEDERFVFAVGEDGVARGWSLVTGGDPLFQLVCPKNADAYRNSDFPRIAYSSHWGGVNGNAALLLAANGELCVYELTLDD